MSRSNPTLTNPSQKFFKWSGSKGKLVYYDKEKQEEIEVKPPFSFLVLDQLATITGYNEQDGSNYWSNEVRSVANEEFTVKTSKGVKEVGLYKNLADVRSKGAKYAKSVYIAHKYNGDFVIGNFKAAGAALTAWIEFSKRYNTMEGKVTLVGSEEAKKGATTYYVPQFEWVATSQDEDEAAIALDKELQTYLSQYLSAARFDRASETFSDGTPVPNEDEIQDMPEDFLQ